MAKRRKGRRSAAASRSRRPAPRRARRPRDSHAEKKSIALLTRELNEALEQQAATSEVLRVISSSPGDLQPVFRTILENATRLCGAKFGTLYLFDGHAFHATAFHNALPAFIEHRKRAPLRPGPDTSLGQAARTKQVAHVVDSMKRESYRRRDPFVVAGAELGGYRTIVSVPMLKDDKLVGVISIYRQQVRPFTDKQIALVTNFAKQAVIAIENVRLFDEVQARTRQLSEALEQQTATSEVLGVISSSPGELEPVFRALLENAVRICEAKFGNLVLFKGSECRVVAMHGAPRAFEDLRRRDPVVSMDRSPWGTIFETKRMIHIADLAAEQPYARAAVAKLAGARTFIGVPMFKENELIGGIAIYRQEVRPFSDKQIALLTSFARQAVIAIENARLLNELQQRTADLSETLEHQTATAGVLTIISRSPSDVQPVFEAIARSAAGLCEAELSAIYRYDGELIYPVANTLRSKEQRELFERIYPIRPGRGTPVARAILEGRTQHVPDTRDDSEVFPAVAKTGFRSALAVPMLRDGAPIGAVAVGRMQVRAFTDAQIKLLETFADQAVIAIENTRLLNELRESLQQQTATADVLKVISRSTFDLQTVLDTLVESA